MAMLAEPRNRKRRYHLNPKGKALYEDDSRFGTKMLEKMGWSKGKGLGVNEDGAKDFVRVRFKDDAAGLGFDNSARDDQWTSHEDSFNGLLISLNGGAESQTNIKDGVDTNNSEGSDSEMRTVGFGFKNEVTKPKKSEGTKLKENISGLSLEEKSANSRARVHYKKFTRGKDLSRYSEKDLANIFGKKVANVETEATGAQSNTVKEGIEQKASNPDFVSHFAGGPTVSTGLSVSDYFKQKMESLKNKKKSKETTLGQEQTPLIEENTQLGNAEKQKTKKRKKHAGEIEEIKEKDREEEEDIIVPSKKKKKHKNKKQDVEEMPLLETTESTEIKQKKKKKKGNNAIQEHIANEMEVEGEQIIQKQRKSKHVEEVKETALTGKKESKKKKSISEKALPLINPDLPVIDEKERNRTAKKTKKKRKSEELINPTQLANIADHNQTSVADIEHVEVPIKKKNKKSKNKDNDIDNVVDTPSVSVLTQEPVDKSSSNESDCSEASTQSQAKLLSMEELLEKDNSFNTYTISQFCAEKFRNFQLSAFNNSSLADIVGYGMSETVKLNVAREETDEKRLLDLWANKTIKYAEAKAFRKHVRKFQETKRENVKRDQLSAIKRRHAFVCI